jgi:hypothetical protein
VPRQPRLHRQLPRGQRLAPSLHQHQQRPRREGRQPRAGRRMSAKPAPAQPRAQPCRHLRCPPWQVTLLAPLAALAPPPLARPLERVTEAVRLAPPPEAEGAGQETCPCPRRCAKATIHHA